MMYICKSQYDFHKAQALFDVLEELLSKGSDVTAQDVQVRSGSFAMSATTKAHPSKSCFFLCKSKALFSTYVCCAGQHCISVCVYTWA